MAISLSSLSLFVATPEQITESRRRTCVQWARGMTQEEYLARDAFTDRFENAANGKLITWVLAERNDPTSLNFLCSGETFRRKGVVWRSTGGRAPQPEKVTCYAIASVFTPLENRKKGYAKHMMSLLHWVLAAEELLPAFPAEWGSPPARVQHAGAGLFSALWSDIGKDVYRRCGIVPGQEGWVVFDPISTIWNIQPEEPSPADTKEGGFLDWKWLDEDGVLKLWESDAEDISGSLEVSKTAPVSVAFLPDEGVAAFQHRRFEFFMAEFPRGRHYGIVSGSASVPFDENVVFATWTMEVHPSAPRTLLVTRLRSPAKDFSRLFEKLMQAAREYRLERIEIYNLGEELEKVAGSLGGEKIERDEHMPALMWYGPERTGEIGWLFNERSVEIDICWEPLEGY
ncbi:hypothetical protein BDZ94DRAFT_1219118 [Collybia nuda]|uniref:LYC1 C-terminal domain-containing protein n=1 Tax=Collybia nuda TaxID=64659 RepID=A0A9P5Y880_9AGAR|nr:hypothetical protein BDZ94DRAFT_1219118 [Collybia nuda]